MLSPVVVHVMYDEKFNDMGIRLFEAAAPGLNEYWVTAQQLRLTKSKLARICDFADLDAIVSRPEVVGVIFHSMPLERYKTLRKVPSEKTVVWIGWGYDYYFLIEDKDSGPLVLPDSKMLTNNESPPTLKERLRPFYHKIRYPMLLTKQTLKRVDFFSPVLDLEYGLIANHVSLRAKYLEWNYGIAEEDFGSEQIACSLGNNILAGNSASATNNHVELFCAIRDQVDVSERKVIAPLSYGDEAYGRKVIDVGYKMFGDSFVPLVDFMSSDDYVAVIRSCGYVAMNHLRQQALGNICIAMMQGKKVFLNNKNPLKEWIIKRGGVVYGVDKINVSPIMKSEQEANRLLVCDHWGYENQVRRTKNIINLILERVPKSENVGGK